MRYITFICALILNAHVSVVVAGGKYNEKARVLSAAIYYQLIAHGVCTSSDDCRSKEVFYGDHDNEVVFNFYGISDSDVVVQVIGSAMDFSRREGVPVNLSFYSEVKRNLLGLKKLAVKPRIKVEINR